MAGARRGDFLPNGLAGELARGLMRMFAEAGHSCLAEFKLGNRRRVDLMAVDRGGRLTIVEIKTSAADFLSDRKWHEYLPWCDAFYFAVPADFDRDLLPAEYGVLVADRYGAATLRPSPEFILAPARRKALILRFARIAGWRLMRLDEPDFA